MRFINDTPPPYDRARFPGVTIHDNGPGIPPEVLARLGEPFFTTRAQGTGLGLHLSRQLVQGAGGQLTLASAPGAGTTVTAEFPAV